MAPLLLLAIATAGCRHGKAHAEASLAPATVLPAPPAHTAELPAHASALPAKVAALPALPWTQRSDWVNVKTACGAAGDGRHDDTANIQAALDAATSGETVYFPPGTYNVTSTLSLACSSKKFGVVLLGCGRDSTLSWHGAAGGDMVGIDSNSYGRYEGLVLDGRGIAANGFHHRNTKWFETSVRNKYLAFCNFTNDGIFSDNSSGIASAETSYENCLFQNCAGWGAYILGFNEYDHTFAGCDFLSCGDGIGCSHGNCYVRDCYFQDSAKADLGLGGEHGMSVRRCKSSGSAQFLFTNNAVTPISVQDCYVTGWKGPGLLGTTGAIATIGAAPVTIAHCRFVNPPNAQAPIQARAPLPIFSCDNAAPGSARVIDAPAGSKIYAVPAGNYPALVGGPGGANIATFLNENATVPPRTFDAVTDFKADPTGAADSTVAIQNAIDAAGAHGKGAIAYLPRGSYKISATLHLTGSDYIFGGNGYFTSIVWAGAAGGVMMSVVNPHHVTLENMLVGHDAGSDGADIAQTGGGGPSLMTYDGIYVYGKYANKPTVQGLSLSGLNKSDTVVLNLVEGNLRVLNSASATIIGNITYEGAISVDDAGATRGGFLGIQTRLSTGNAYGVYVRDSNNIVMSDWYQEQNTGGVSLAGVPGNLAGRVTIQSANTDLPAGSRFLSVDNYTGQVFYGTNQMYPNTKTESIVQTGTMPLEIVLFGNAFYNTQLTSSLTSGTLATVGNWPKIGTGAPPPDNPTPTTPADMALAYDDLQHLGALDLALNYHDIDAAIAAR